MRNIQNKLNRLKSMVNPPFKPNAVRITGRKWSEADFPAHLNWQTFCSPPMVKSPLHLEAIWAEIVKLGLAMRPTLAIVEMTRVSVSQTVR